MIVVNAMPIGRARHPLARASALFESDWSTATGSLTSAVSDGSKWPNVDNGSSVLSVVTAPSGFPSGMTNVLRLQVGAATAIGCSVSIKHTDNTFPAPGVGETLYFRTYVRNDVDGEGDRTGSWNSTHPLQAGSSTVANLWGWRLSSTGAGTWPLQVTTNGYPTTQNYGWLLGGRSTGSPIYTSFFLTCTEVYRLEWAVTKTATDTYTFDVRVYDSAGGLLFNGSGSGASRGAIYRSGGSSTPTLASGGSGLSMEDDWITSLFVGSNGGWASYNFSQARYIYYGGVMVRSDDWCGAY